LDAEHRHDRVPHGLRIGDTHHPHHLVVEQSLHPLTRRGGGEPDLRPQIGVRHATVALEFGEDRLVDLVQVDGGNWSFVALPGAALGSTQWRGVRLTEADLDRVQAVGAVWRDLDLTGASLVGIDLRQADLRGSSLWSLDPAAAQLSGAIVTPEQALVIAAALGLDVRVDD